RLYSTSIQRNQTPSYTRLSKLRVPRIVRRRVATWQQHCDERCHGAEASDGLTPHGASPERVENQRSILTMHLRGEVATPALQRLEETPTRNLGRSRSEARSCPQMRRLRRVG